MLVSAMQNITFVLSIFSLLPGLWSFCQQYQTSARYSTGGGGGGVGAWKRSVRVAGDLYCASLGSHDLGGFHYWMWYRKLGAVRSGGWWSLLR